LEGRRQDPRRHVLREEGRDLLVPRPAASRSHRPPLRVVVAREVRGDLGPIGARPATAGRRPAKSPPPAARCRGPAPPGPPSAPALRRGARPPGRSSPPTAVPSPHAL